MGTFIGSKLEFKKYFGGYCRNKVHEITNPNRKSRNGICEYCKNKAELQAAHLQGFERVKLIDLLLDVFFKKGDDEYLVDLDTFEKEFIKAHQPIDKNFHFLCHKCHAKYDKDVLSEAEILQEKNNYSNKSNIIEKISKKTLCLDNNIKNTSNEVHRNTSNELHKNTDNELYKNEEESVQELCKKIIKYIIFKKITIRRNDSPITK